MLPALLSAIIAYPWQFFDNLSSLNWLVNLQAVITVVRNCTLFGAAWWIWCCSRQEIIN